MKTTDNRPSTFDLRIPFQAGVTEKEMRRAAEVWSDYEIRDRKRQEEKATQFLDSMKRRSEKVRRIIGAEHFFALEQFKQALRLEDQPPRPPVRFTASIRADLVRSQQRRVRRFLLDRGLAPDKISPAVDRVFEGITFPFDDFVGTIEDATQGDPPPPGPHDFVTVTPPYTGHGTGYVETQLGFSLEHENLGDPMRGEVGLVISLSETGSRETTSASMNRSSQVAFWFRAPATGIVEVVTNYQSINARHQLTVEDECGFSNAEVVQRHLLSMQVVTPQTFEPTFHLASQMTYDGDDPVFLNHRHLPAGHKLQTRMASTGVVRSGEVVLVAVGCRSEDRAYSNDMKVESKSTFHWFIPRVHVRVLP